MLRKLISHDLKSLNGLSRLFTSSSATCQYYITPSVPDPDPEDVLQTTPTPEMTPDPMPQRGSLPIITSRKLEFMPIHRAGRQAWVENLDQVDEVKLGLVDLHPSIFGAFPRTDLIFENIDWQTKYRVVKWEKALNRAEMPGGGRKPWPQKGLGKARHGSIRSPLWLGGGRAHGPRGPTSMFYMLDRVKRSLGLISTLSAKFAQDDIHIVDTLDIPTTEGKFLKDLVEKRSWGISTLFIDDTDIFPKNISLATNDIEYMNIMPVYGLNVYSMLKHETLVLTIAAVNRIEEKLLYQIHRNDPVTGLRKFRGVNDYN